MPTSSTSAANAKSRPVIRPPEIVGPTEVQDGVDDVDAAIIECLVQDGRASFRSIAEQLDMADATIGRRVTRLLDEGIIQVVAVPNMLEVPETVVCIVQLLVQDNPEVVAQHLSSWPEAMWIVICAGAADIVLSLYVDGLPALEAALARLNALPEVTKLESFVCLDIVKHGYLQLLAREQDSS